MNFRNATLFLIGFCLGVLVTSLLYGNDLDAAIIDRHQFPSEMKSRLYYFSLETVDPDKRDDCLAALKFTLASTSKIPEIELCAPIPVSKTLYRIDCQALGWDPHVFRKVLAATDYKRLANYHDAHFVNDPKWFIHEVWNSTESNAYELLLYGQEKLTLNEFLQYWGTNTDPRSAVPWIEASSGVSVEKWRWLLNFDTNQRGLMFGTLDFLNLDAKNDPLQNLGYWKEAWQKTPIHDGSEWIFQMRKESIRTGEAGSLQVYGLFDQAGNPVDSAPGQLVHDDKESDGHGDIINGVSCVVCHDRGMKLTNRNGFRELLEATQREPKYDDYRLLRSMDHDLNGGRDSYDAAIRAITGLDSVRFVTAFRSTYDDFKADVTPQQAARELYSTPAQVTDALAFAAASGVTLPNRLSALANGASVPRDIWADLYLPTYLLLEDWKHAQRPEINKESAKARRIEKLQTLSR